MSVATTGTPTESPAVAPSRRHGTGTVVLAAAVGVLVGFAVGVLVLRPESPPGDTSPEAGFARDMTTHHAQAVTMGIIAFQHAAMPDVRQLGYDIAMTQQGQIGTMQQWLRDWELLPTGSEPPMTWMQEDLDLSLVRDDALMPGVATPEQMDQLREAEGTEVDRLFLELMTYHHLGGIHMVDGVLARSEHPEVTWLADLMKSGQASELQAMRDLQDRLGDA